MTYTINQLAKLSDVTTRTLRFYNEIGLLRPAYIAENGYRYYEESNLFSSSKIAQYMCDAMKVFAKRNLN